MRVTADLDGRQAEMEHRDIFCNSSEKHLHARLMEAFSSENQKVLPKVAQASRLKVT